MTVSRPFVLLLVLLALTADSVPAGVGVWTSQGPYQDTILSLAIDPQAPSTVYAGTLRHGVFKTTDGGTTWRNNSSLPEHLRFLAIDPLTPSTVYAGFENDVVYRTTDGGESWYPLGDGFIACIRGLVLAPTTPATVYAATFDTGIFRSTDGGETWSAVNEGLPTRLILALAIDPQTPSILYAGTMAGLFKSVDGGQSWSLLADIPADPNTIPAQLLVVDPQTPSTLYAATDGAYGLVEDGLWLWKSLGRSVDGGATWSSLDGSLPAAGGIASLAIDPRTPSTLYLGMAGGLWKSTDGAASWAFLGPVPREVAALAIDVEAPSTVYQGTYASGMWKSADGGATWAAVNDGLGRASVEELAVDPGASGLYAGSSRGSVFRSVDRGKSWTLLRTPFPYDGYLTDLEVDPVSPATVYAVTALAAAAEDNALWKSTDGGESWTAIRRGFQAASLELDPVTPSLYLLTTDDLLTSQDGGASWSSGASPPDGTYIGSLTIDPQTPTTLYVTTLHGLFVSTDGGGAWTEIPHPYYQVYPLAVDPQAPSALYALISGSPGPGNLWKSTDGGASWSPTGLNHGATGLVIGPGTPSVLYAATTKKVFRSTDGGVSWAPFGTGLSFPGSLGPLALAAADPPIVFAATPAGVFDIEVVPPGLGLQGGRFQVEIEWRDFNGATGQGTVAAVSGSPAGEVPLASRDSAVVEFFGPDNWEVLVKTLDGSAVNGRFWVFLAAATNVGFATTVTDTSCGETRTYVNPLGVAAPAVTDTDAFAGCASPSPPDCVASTGVLCLGDGGRFRVEIVWADFLGNTGRGRQVHVPAAGLATSADSGLFYFFSEENWELLAKVLDGCKLNGHFWVFGAATTNVGYTLQVTDKMTGVVRTYTNPLGRPAPALTDTLAFPTCGADG